MTPHFRRLHLLGGLGAAVALIVAFEGHVETFCNSAAPGVRCHPDMVRRAFGFLRASVVDTIAAHVSDPDGLRVNFSSSHHFDNCTLKGGIEHINESYRELVPLLQPGGEPQVHLACLGCSRPFVAAARFGFLLHGVQDFYSHSNWVEMGRRDLFDSGTGPWAPASNSWSFIRPGVVFADEPTRTAPRGWSVSVETDNRLPVARRHVPTVTVSGTRYPLLLTGQTGTLSSCAAVVIPHDAHPPALGLNKDRFERSDFGPANPLGDRLRRWGEFGYQRARDLAEAQTRHEWCRLLHIARSRMGIERAAVPFGLWVDPSSRGDVGCGDSREGPLEVKVEVRGITMSGAREEGAALNFVLTAFTDDFRRSARSASATVPWVGAGGSVHSSGHPAPTAICVDPDQTVVATVQGWNDTARNGARGVLDASDRVLRGATYILGRGAELAVRSNTTVSRTSDGGGPSDLRVEFSFSVGRTDDDGDGVSLCAELAAGTDPRSADTNSDGVSDGVEAIERSYAEAFGRFPEEAELQTWLSALPAGQLITRHVAFLASPAGAGELEATIKRTYQRTFGRTPTVEESAAWNGGMLRDALTFDDVMSRHLDFLLSPDGRPERQATVDRAYGSAFGRPPNDYERAVWIRAILDDRVGFADIVGFHREFLTGPEGTREVDAVIGRAFGVKLQRAPTTQELADWRRRVRSDGITFEEIAAELR